MAGFPSTFHIPRTNVSFDGTQKLRHLLKSDSISGSVPGRMADHKFVDANGEATIFVGVQSGKLDMLQMTSAADIRPGQIHEHELVFTVRRMVEVDDSAPQTVAVLLAHWQVNVVLGLMYTQALVEWAQYRGKILDNAKMPNSATDLTNMSERDIWRMAQRTTEGKSGVLNVVAFLSRRYILDTFNFAGVTKTNAEIQSPDGYGHSVVMGGIIETMSCFLTPTKELDHIFWILKRRRLSQTEHGAFAYHLYVTSLPEGPGPQLISYSDMGGFLQYGAVIPVGFISDKLNEDPPRETSVMCAGLTDAPLSKIHFTVLSLKTVKVCLTNYGVKIPVRTL